MIGRTLSQYKVVEKLGEGGMGEVYLAEDTKLKRQVALKFLSSDQTTSEEQKKRFIREARAASNLDHPHIGTIYQIDETRPAPGKPGEGELFIAMAYYAGDTLKDRMAEGSLSVEFAVRVAQQMAQGLAKAHAKGIVHRDIKPANILFTEEDEVKIVDFGLAKLADQSLLTKTGTTMGTVLYMSPEHVQGQPVDQRTDIWALGVILYEMLTGTHPFAGDYEHAVMYSIVNEEPEPVLDVPAGLAAIIERALAKKQEERYKSMDELLADLNAVYEELGTSKAATAAFRSRLRRRKFKKFLRPLAVALVPIVAALVYFWPNPDVEADQVSIAVLPLKGIGEAQQEEWFQDSMTEEVITGLTKIGGLRVISRTTMMWFKTHPKPIPEVAKELNVDYVIEGSVVRLGDQIKISTALVDAQDNRNIWAQNYQRNFGNALRLQAEIAQAIAKEVKVELSPEEASRFANVREVDPEAYEAYLKGRFQIANHATGWSKALEHFEEAIAKDSSFAQSYAGAADALWWMYTGSGPIEVEEKITFYIDRAVELDSMNSEVNRTRGWRLFMQGDWTGGEFYLKQAIELDQNNANAHNFYGQLLCMKERFEEGIKETQVAARLDPLNKLVKLIQGWAYYWARDYDASIGVYEQTLELDPNYALTHYNLGMSYLAKEMYPEAMRALQKSNELSAGKATFVRAQLARVYTRTGQRQKASEILDDLKQQPLLQVGIHVELGEKHKALDLLEVVFEQNPVRLSTLNFEEQYDPLRSEPRFHELQRRFRDFIREKSGD